MSIKGGTWTTSGSAGTISGDDPDGGSYGVATGGGTKSPKGNTYLFALGYGTCAMSGAMTATFTWDGPTGTEPQAVVVRQDSVAEWGGNTGSCSSGLQNHTKVPTQYGERDTGWKYEVVTNPPHSFTRTCAPSGDATYNVPIPNYIAGGVNVSYTASATPLTLTLSGVLNPQTDKRLLIGQKLTANVAGVPAGANTYTWIIGGGPFTSYTPSTPASQFVPYNPPNASSTSCSFAGAGTKSVQCAVYVAVANQTVTLSQQATAVAPDFQAWGVQGQAMLNSPGTSGANGMHLKGATCLDPDDEYHDGGMLFIGWVETPADFRGGSSGTNYGLWNYTQLVTAVNSWVQDINGTYYDWDQNFSGATKLDNQYPAAGPFSADHGLDYFNDEPGMSLPVGVVEAFFSSSHQTHVNYIPPGSGSQLVSLLKFNWAWQGRTTFNTTTSAFTTPTHSEFWSYGGYYPAQPMWTSVASNLGSYVPRP